MLSHSSMPVISSWVSLSFHATKLVSLLRASSCTLHLRVSSLSVVEMSSRDILPWDMSASLAESKTSSSPPLASSPERTSTLLSDAVHEWTDPSPALALDPAGDPSPDPLPLPDLEPKPDKLNELERLPRPMLRC